MLFFILLSRTSRKKLDGLEEQVENVMEQSLDMVQSELKHRIDKTNIELHHIAADKGMALKHDGILIANNYTSKLFAYWIYTKTESVFSSKNGTKSIRTALIYKNKYYKKTGINRICSTAVVHAIALSCQLVSVDPHSFHFCDICIIRDRLVHISEHVNVVGIFW